MKDQFANLMVISGVTGTIFWFVDSVGRALCLALGAKGVFVIVVDFNEERRKEVASLVQKEGAKVHSDLQFPYAHIRYLIVLVGLKRV